MRRYIAFLCIKVDNNDVIQKDLALQIIINIITTHCCKIKQNILGCFINCSMVHRFDQRSI